MNRVGMYTLRRRRLAGLGVLVAFLMMGFAANGWSVMPFWTAFDTKHGLFVAGDPYGDWIYAECDGKAQQITVSRNGRLEGVAGLESLRSVSFPNWCNLPTVDNPNLAQWRDSQARLIRLTEQPGASAAAVLDAARDMPTSYLYLKPVADYIRRDPAHSAAFLDALAEQPMRFDHPDASIVRARRNAFSALIDDALERAVARGTAPERIEAWAAQEQIAAGSGRLEALARAPDLSDRSAQLLLERLDVARGTKRAELFAMLAPRVAHDDRFAPVLVDKLRLLPPHSRSVNATQLLVRPDVSAELPVAFLASFRRTFARSSPQAQLDVYMAIASKVKSTPGAPQLLTTHLRHIPDVQRRMAATYLLTLDEPGETQFALAVLRSFSDVHPRSRSKLLYSVMDSPQFSDPAVQEACLSAVRLQVSGPERQELLGALLRRSDLEQDLYSRIRAELG